jgi:hypothetical protein
MPFYSYLIIGSTLMDSKILEYRSDFPSHYMTVIQSTISNTNNPNDTLSVKEADTSITTHKPFKSSNAVLHREIRRRLKNTLFHTAASTLSGFDHNSTPTTSLAHHHPRVNITQYLTAATRDHDVDDNSHLVSSNTSIYNKNRRGLFSAGRQGLHRRINSSQQ